jgi:hypothetical protein
MIQLQPELEAQLFVEAQARGLELDSYVGEIVNSHPARAISGQSPRHSVAEAIQRILELRELSTLDGLKIEDLIEQGRKWNLPRRCL